MRIGILGPLPPLRGGISHYNASLVAALMEQNHDVTTVSYRQLYPKFLFPGTSEYDDSSKPVSNSNPIVKAWSPNTWRSAATIFKQTNIDLFVVHHWQPIFAPSSQYILKHSGADKTVAIAHNVLPHEKKLIGIPLNRRLYKSAGRVFVGATSEREKIENLFDIKASEVVPHPAYDRFAKIHPELSQSEAKVKLGLDSSKPYLLHMGLIRSYKGVKTLLEAISLMQYRDVNIEVAGEFYDDPEEYFTLIRKYKLENLVKITNQYLSDADAALRLRAADVMILPYHHATQSGMAMSALACGVPVIASAVGALIDVIDDGVNGYFVQPEAASELAEKIDSFINYPWQELAKRRFAIQEQTLRDYSWQALAERLIAS
ncbi:glycosyltransferase [bacterium]|nr:glycosyltransferase [bacterium]